MTSQTEANQTDQALVLLGHGAGGRLSRELIEDHVLPALGNPVLEPLLDSALLDNTLDQGDELALTTDGYVVSPRFFPGGDLGRIAVCGTVNDLWMVGAEPLGLTCAMILEEGLPLAELDRMLASMAAAAKEAGVDIVAGDTKVVPRGACDGAFITTAGVGRRRPSFTPEPRQVSAGDVVLISGTLGDHGMAVLACREGLSLRGDLESDVAPLGALVRGLREGGVAVSCLRDPTRGGVAQALSEVAEAAGCRVAIDERALPLKPAVRSACELLGLDALHLANEGKLLAFVPAAQADRALELLRADPLGAAATRIGVVEPAGELGPGVELETPLGARRSLRMPAGELLPRIC